mmetsp:Transcript_75762/g.149755  ORF Transcript_75762/g.149755 Transcript_75762/m.149755 type:complete len:92 (-) Transcript_75762:446-721(-)
MPVSLQDTLLRGDIPDMVTPLHAEQAEPCFWTSASDKRPGIFGVAIDRDNVGGFTGVFPPWLTARLTAKLALRLLGVLPLSGPWLAVRLTV